MNSKQVAGPSPAGFSIIELLIVLVMLSVFALAAIGVYRQYTASAMRNLAQAELLQLGARLESEYTSANGYPQLAAYDFPETSPTYRISISRPDNHSYRISAMPVANQAGDGLLYLDSLGERRHYQADNQSGAYSAW